MGIWRWWKVRTLCWAIGRNSGQHHRIASDLSELAISSDANALTSVLPELLRTLPESNQHVRQLCQLARKCALPAFSRVLHNSDNAHVHELRAAIRGLGFIGDPSVLQPILTVAERSSDSETIGCAIKAIGRIGSADTIDRIVQICRSNRGGSRGAAVAAAVFWALAKIGNPKALPFLEEYAGPDPTLRVLRIAALANCGSGEARTSLNQLVRDLRTSRQPVHMQLLSEIDELR